MIRPVDDVAFQKEKSLKEGKNYEIDNIEMEIIDEGVLDNVLEVPGKTLDGDKNQKKFDEIIDNKYFKKSDADFPKLFLLKRKKEFNVSHLILFHSKKLLQQISVEYGLFSQIVKIIWKIVGEIYMASKKKKQKNQYLNLKVSRNDQ